MEPAPYCLLYAGKNRQYRYVLIPGGAAVRRNVDWNNYEAVKTYLGLKD